VQQFHWSLFRHVRPFFLSGMNLSRGNAFFQSVQGVLLLALRERFFAPWARIDVFFPLRGCLFVCPSDSRLSGLGRPRGRRPSAPSAATEQKGSRGGVPSLFACNRASDTPPRDACSGTRSLRKNGRVTRGARENKPSRSEKRKTGRATRGAQEESLHASGRKKKASHSEHRAVRSPARRTAEPYAGNA
jgi:hypothetical protein